MTARATAEALYRRAAALDLNLLLLVRRCERSALTRIMRALTHLGDPGSWVAIGLALAATGGEGPRYAALLGVAAGLATAASQIVKRLCCRPRPSAALGLSAVLAENPDAFSFPSGHTAAAVAVAVALAGQGSGLGALALALAVGIGLSRVYLAAHYPADVAAGGLLGVAAGLAARLLEPADHLAALLGTAHSALIGLPGLIF